MTRYPLGTSVFSAPARYYARNPFSASLGGAESRTYDDWYSDRKSGRLESLPRLIGTTSSAAHFYLSRVAVAHNPIVIFPNPPLRTFLPFSILSCQPRQPHTLTYSHSHTSRSGEKRASLLIPRFPPTPTLHIPYLNQLQPPNPPNLPPLAAFAHASRSVLPVQITLLSPPSSPCGSHRTVSVAVSSTSWLSFFPRGFPFSLHLAEKENQRNLSPSHLIPPSPGQINCILDHHFSLLDQPSRFKKASLAAEQSRPRPSALYLGICAAIETCLFVLFEQTFISPSSPVTYKGRGRPRNHPRFNSQSPASEIDSRT